MMHQNPQNVAPVEVTVRPAKPSDLPMVVAIEAEVTGVQKASYWKERFAWYTSGHSDRFFLIAEQGGTPVGFAVGEVRAWEFGSPPSGWIFAINVRASARLHGLGTVLFDAICERFRKAGVKHVRTMVGRDEQLLLSFFRSQGMMAGPFVELEKVLES
jgi:ribosomal protein S18 acetylase RimI-like enzyme